MTYGIGRKQYKRILAVTICQFLPTPHEKKEENNTYTTSINHYPLILQSDSRDKSPTGRKTDEFSRFPAQLRNRNFTTFEYSLATDIVT